MSCPVVNLGGFRIDALTEAEVIAHVLNELSVGRGGKVVTLNVDIFRAASMDPALRRLVCDASLLVADGMPVVWASKMNRTPVPERVTGASLIHTLTKAAAEEGRSVYLLGGAPGVPQQARVALCRDYPDLAVVGTDAPPFGFDATPDGLDEVCDRVIAAEPDIAYVGLGFPKQEQLIARLAPKLPSCWFVGCGAAISFAAGTLHRAPHWVQEAGLEWLFRLVSEPRRLAHRYLVDDLPFAASLMFSTVAQRFASVNGEQPELPVTAATVAEPAPAVASITVRGPLTRPAIDERQGVGVG